MKKIFNLFILVVFSMLLVGCEGLTIPSDIVISFETNGGTTIEAQTIKLEDASTFVLPADPTKEGFEFDGWYIDAEFNGEFSVELLVRDITLYAKWKEVVIEPDPGIEIPEYHGGLTLDTDVLFEVTETVDNDSESEQLKANISVVVESVKFEKLEDLKLEATLKVEVDEQQIELGFIIANGYLYTAIPASYIGGDQDFNISIDVKKVYAKIVELVGELEEDETNEYSQMFEQIIAIIENSSSFEELLDEILKLVFADYEFDEEFVATVTKLAKESFATLVTLIPQVKVEDNETTYYIDDAQFSAFIDALYEVVKNNLDLLLEFIGAGEYEEVEHLFPVYVDGEKEYYVSSSTNHYIDDQGVDHTYADDTEFKLGKMVGKYYVPQYAYGYLYDTSNEWAQIPYYLDGTILGAVDYYLLDDFKILLGGLIIDVTSENSPISIDDIAVEYEEGVYYCHIYGTYINADFSPVSEEKLAEILEEEKLKQLEEIRQLLETAKELVDINELKFSFAQNDQGFIEYTKFALDIDINDVEIEMSEDLSSFEYLVEEYLNFKFEMRTDYTYGEDIKISVIDTTLYIDYTDFIIEGIESSLNGDYEGIYGEGTIIPE